MSRRFRDFVRSHPFHVSLREDEAAPSMGGAPGAPPNPDSNGGGGGTTDKHHFSALKYQLDMGDGDFLAGLEDGVQSLYPPAEFAKQRWGMEIGGMVPAYVKKREDGNYDVNFMLDIKKGMQPKSLFYAGQKGQTKDTYDGDVGGVHEILSQEELIGMMTPMFRGGGQAQPGGGMGGAPGGGMGAPPAPPGGGMGAPPMGGM